MISAVDWPDDIELPVVGGSPARGDLEVLLAATAAQLGTDDPQVVATMAWKRYAFSVAIPAMQALGRHGFVPDLSLANSVVTVSPTEPLVSVALVEPRATAVPDLADTERLTAALAPLRGGHLHPVIDELRELRRVARRGLDVMEHVTIVSSLAEVEGLDQPFDRCAQLLAAVDPEQRNLVELAELALGEFRKPMVLRSACCLVYRARPDHYCVTCNLVDDARRTDMLAARGFEWRRIPQPTP